jgi:hypothetical protein
MSETNNCCQAFYVIAVSDLDQAFKFYRLVFDADHQYRDRGLNFLSLRSSIPGLEYVVLWQVPPGLPFERMCVRGTRLTCRCDELNHTHETLLRRGLPASPISEMPGIRYFVLADPDGNEIGFFEFIPE